MQESVGPEYVDDTDDMEGLEYLDDTDDMEGPPTWEEVHEARRVMVLESYMWEAYDLGFDKEYERLKAALEE